MSMLSPLDDDLLLVYSPLCRFLFVSLLERGFSLIEVPEQEFASQGATFLRLLLEWLLPRQIRKRVGAWKQRGSRSIPTLETISVKGCGGPTCLTRP